MRQLTLISGKPTHDLLPNRPRRPRSGLDGVGEGEVWLPVSSSQVQPARSSSKLCTLPRLRSCPQGVDKWIDKEGKMPVNTSVYIPQLEAEVRRLRSLVLRPKRIEWVQEGDVLWGQIDNDELFKILTFPNSVNAESVKEWIEFDEYLPTLNEAKAACQSAFDAWIGQFMEVGE